MRLIVPARDQGQTNGCGTACLSAVMDFWKPGRPENAWPAIEAALRPFDWYTAPGELLRYARLHGFEAAILLDARPEELLTCLDRGWPAIALCDRSGGLGRSLHYMVAVGYEADDEGPRVTWMDPAQGGFWSVRLEDFDREWQDLTFRGWPTCLGRVLVVAVPAGSGLATWLPVRPLPTAAAMLIGPLGIKDAAIAWRNRNLLRLIAGALEVALSLPGMLGCLMAGAASRARHEARTPIGWSLALLASLGGGILQTVGMGLSGLATLIGDPLVTLSMRQVVD